MGEASHYADRANDKANDRDIERARRDDALDAIVGAGTAETMRATGAPIPEPRPAQRDQFRNIVDWRLDGDTRWTILHVTRDEQYKRWGARVVVYFPPEDRRAMGAAFLLLDDGAWYYAHADGGTAWCDMSEGYAVATGEQAIAAEKVHRARRDLRYATEAAEKAAREVADAIEAWQRAWSPE